MRPRPALADLRPYEPGKPAAEVRRELGLERIVKLASNEGPYGPFPAALEAIARQAPELNRYPELGGDLVERLAARHGVAPEQVAVGNGVDSIVGCLALAYLDPGDEAVMGWPSFISYRLDTIKQAATPVMVPLRDGVYDLDAMAERIGPAHPDRLRLQPEQPDRDDGRPRRSCGRSSTACPSDVLVVVDEAYHEYVTDPDYPDAIAEHVLERPNVAGAAHVLEDLRPRRPAGRLHGRPGRRRARDDEGAKRRSTSPSWPTSPPSRASTTRPSSSAAGS